MVYLIKKETETIFQALSKTNIKEIRGIIKKLKYPEKKRVYLYGKLEVIKLLRKAFHEKRKVKIRYYSSHSDENTIRVIDIYKIYNGVITAFCHLREDERNFVIDRINSVAILDKKDSIPKGWSPESVVLDK